MKQPGTPAITQRTRAFNARAARARLAAIVEASEDAILGKDPDGIITDWNRAAERLYGYTAAEAVGRPITMLAPPGREHEIEDLIERLRRGEPVPYHETQRRRKDGTLVQVSMSVSPFHDGAGRVIGSSVIARDIGTRVKADALVAGQRRVLERIVQDNPLPDVLADLVCVIEAQAVVPLLASILLIDEDGVHLRHGAAPSLPSDYVAAIDGVAIGPRAGSCGTAAYRREPVTVEDIATDPLWDDWREIALRNGLRACWSTPILGADGDVLGTFALYYPRPHAPAPEERQIVDLLTRTAAVAIERTRATAERERLLGSVQAARAEAEMERGRLQEVFQQAPVALALLEGPDHVVRFANPLFLLSIGRAEVLGYPIRQAMPELAGQRYLTLLDQVYQRGEPYAENEASVLLDRQGTGMLEEVFFDFVYQPMRGASGSVTGILVSGIEVTGRVRARRASQRQGDLIQSITTNATLGLMMMDARRHCTFMNPAAERITGFTLTEVQGAPLHDFIHHSRPDGSPYPLDECPINRALPGRMRIRGEEVFIHKDGHFYPAAFTASPIFEEGVSVGTVLEIEDITARRQAEAERARLLASERAARAEAEEALRVRDALVSFATHDLRTPLTTVKGQAQMLRRLVARDRLTPEILAAGLAGIDAAGSTMNALIGELLDTVRLQAGQHLDLQPESTDLVALVRRCVAEQQQAAERHALRVVSGETPLLGAWDPVRLERVMSNLLTNAIKFSPNGGTITVTVGPRALDGCDWAEVAVQDEGLGIPAADLPHIFERFHRASNVVDRFAGSGIGLAGAKQLVEQHGGTLTVISVEGVGTTFTLRLPVGIVPATA